MGPKRALRSAGLTAHHSDDDLDTHLAHHLAPPRELQMVGYSALPTAPQKDIRSDVLLDKHSADWTGSQSADHLEYWTVY